MDTDRVTHPVVPSGAGLGKYQIKDRVKCEQYEAYASTQTEQLCQRLSDHVV